MDSNQKFFDAHTATWLSNGFDVKSKLLRAVGDGDVVSIQGFVADYITAMSELLGEDLAFAKDSAYFIFAQVSAAGTINGLEDWAAYNLKEGYYFAVDKADNVPDVLGFMKNFILDFTNAVHRAKVESRYSPIVREVCEYIYLNISEKLTIQRIADEFHFSKSYISHKFKEEVGMSVMDYLNYLRINEAKFMLHQHIPTITVAQQLGFSSQSHFTCVFHARTGMTPGEWRKQI